METKKPNEATKSAAPKETTQQTKTQDHVEKTQTQAQPYSPPAAPAAPVHSPTNPAPSTVGGFAFGADPARKPLSLRERGVRGFAGFYDRLVENSDFRPGQRLWLIIGKDGRGQSVQEESPPNDVPCCEVFVSLATDTRFDLLTTPSGAAIPEFPNPRPEIRPIEHTPDGEQIPAAETAARHEAARQERKERLDSLIPEGTNPSTVQAAVEAKAQDEAIKQG